MPDKVCVICGADVADKPRVKDAQGKYACQACVQKRQAGTAAKPAAGTKSAAVTKKPASQDALWADLPDANDPNIVRCPECASIIRTGKVICGNCGFNTTSGKKVETKIITEGGKGKKGKKDT